MQVITQFSGGLNASKAPNNIGENEVAAASNIDFSLQEGALVARRGSRIKHSGFTGSVHSLYRSYINPYDYGNSPWYIAVGSTIARISGTATSVLATTTWTGDVSARYSNFDESTLISFGGYYIKDNGTTPTEWIMQAPAGTLVATASLQTTPLVVTTSYTAEEGSVTVSTEGIGTAVGTEGGRIVLVSTLGTGSNLNSVSGVAIDDYGVDYLDIAFDIPENVTKISRDYSIGDATFTNYFHTEYTVGDVDTVAATGDMLVDSYQSSNNTTPVDIETRERMLNELRLTMRVPAMVLPKAADTYSLWAVARPNFDLVGKTIGSGWANIGAVRIIIEYTGELTANIANWKIHGDKDHSLNDADIGYVWWETFATIDSNGFIVNESAPCPLSARLQCQHAKVKLTSTSTITGTDHGVTHRIFYRQGGYMRDAYAVGSSTYTTATYTDTLSDIDVLLKGQKLLRNVYTKTSMPAIQAISDPHFNRVFVSNLNNVLWSEPNKPGTFKSTSITKVSQRGDEVQAIINWMPALVIVNRDTVYELSGSVFDGQSADWALYKTGCSRGSKARRTAIRTPYGIPILDYDGLYMYVPGQGTEQKLDWVHARIGDAWTGANSYDPAAMSGARVPAINSGYINTSFAIWANDRLYMGVPTGTSTIPNTLFIMEFPTKRVWHYTYPFSMTCGFWDPDDNGVYVGTPDGVIMRIETNNTDVTTGNVETGITWSVRTKTWTWPDEVRLTNLSLDSQYPVKALVVRNSTSTETIATRTNTVRERYMPTMSGSLANEIHFLLSGTNSTNTNRVALYELNWDAYPEPPKELYHRTEYHVPETEQEYIALNSELDCLGGTITATMKVDGTACGTFTFSSTLNDPRGFTKSFGARVFGRIAYVEYRSTTPFRHYKSHFTTIPEPPRLSYFRTDYFTYDGEQEWKAMAAELDCINGTVLATTFIDNVATSTHTFTGSGPQGYVAALPLSVAYPLNHPFGRSGYIIYSSTGTFKHYKSWFEVLPEPSKVTHFRTPTKIYQEEQEIRTAKCELNCYAGTVTGVMYVDATAISTHTFTGTGYRGFVVSLPEKTYGRSAYIVYSGSASFKHYMTEWDATPEPPRVTVWRTETFNWPTEAHLKTLVANINPLGSVVTGAIRSKGTTIATATFTGTNQEVFNYGLDVESNLARILPTDSVDVYYTSTGTFKHYKTDLQVEPAPFDKKTWRVIYRKMGGATQLDQPHFYSLDVEVVPYLTTATVTTSLGTFVTVSTSNTAICTSIWEVDGLSLSTQTHTITSRQWLDRVSLPSGMRGYLFDQRIVADVPIKVWRSNLDIMRTGIKGLTRSTISGVPN